MACLSMHVCNVTHVFMRVYGFERYSDPTFLYLCTVYTRALGEMKSMPGHI